MAENSRRKFAIVGVSSVILVAMVVALTIGSQNTSTDNYNRQDVSASTKAIKTICDSTDYKDTCIDSLKNTAGNSTDPKELIEAALQVTIKYIKDAANSSVLLQNLQQDPRTRLALENCRELADRAVDDLERSFSKFQNFDFSSLDDLLNDLKIWLSGSVTYQETCLDGFEDTPGDAGEKMRQALNISMQLTSNGLAMITDISSVISSLDFPSFSNRRLLSKNLPSTSHVDDLRYPDWVDAKKRSLLDAAPSTVNPDLVVAKDGSGKYRTINEAINDIPKKSNRTFILYIKEGVYEERVRFNSTLTHLMVIGDGPTKTRITGNLNFIDGTPTYHTATVAALGDYFIAKDIGFKNSAGPDKHQAVALRVGADKAIFFNCHMDGYQDTLYVHTYRQFYRNCVISGTIDFIFGDSAAIFQNCTLVVRKPLDNQQCIVTAQGRKDVRQPTGLVLQNCSFVADPTYYPVRKTLKSYLGRPWKQYSRTIIMESYIDDLIQPEGWVAWNGSFALDTLFYAEFNNRGPGSVKTQRVQWPGVKELPATRVQRYTSARFIESETWIPAAGVPFDPSYIFPLPKEDGSVKYSPVAPEEVKDLGQPKEKGSYSARPDLLNDSVFTPPAPAPTPPAAATQTNTASPPVPAGVSPSSTPFGEAASPPIVGGAPPPTPYTNAASAPLGGGATPPTPYTNTASPPVGIGAPPPTPYINAASPPLGGGAPPPTPDTGAVSPSVEGGAPPPTPDINTASPSVGGGAPPPTPIIDAASPPTESGVSPPSPPQASGNIAPSPTSSIENSQTPPPSTPSPISTPQAGSPSSSIDPNSAQTPPSSPQSSPTAPAPDAATMSELPASSPTASTTAATVEITVSSPQSSPTTTSL